MTNDRRRWYQLFVSTWLLATLGGAVLSVLVFSGNITQIVSGFHSPSCTSYEHGWPWPFVHRDVIGPLPRATFTRVDWLHVDSWMLWKEISHWDSWNLFADIGLALGIIVSFAGACECWRQAHLRWWQWTIRDVLGFVLLVAVILGWFASHLRLRERESVAELELKRGGHSVGEHCGPLGMRRLFSEFFPTCFRHVVYVELVPDHTRDIRSLKRSLQTFTYLRFVEMARHTQGESSKDWGDDDLQALAEIAPHIESLSLEGERLSEVDLATLMKFPRLKELRISTQNDIFDERLGQLRKAKPGCRVNGLFSEQGNE